MHVGDDGAGADRVAADALGKCELPSKYSQPLYTNYTALSTRTLGPSSSAMTLESMQMAALLAQ